MFRSLKAVGNKAHNRRFPKQSSTEIVKCRFLALLIEFCAANKEANTNRQANIINC